MKFNVTLDTLDAFAVEFWQRLGANKVFAFEGEMGAGKTTIIKTLAQAKGIGDQPSSPSFSIINEYRYQEKGVEKKFFHIDLYRLSSHEEIMGAGVEDCVASGEICMIEWPERAPWLFDESSVKVQVVAGENGNRLVEIIAWNLYRNL